jgi:hypothetical protein
VELALALGGERSDLGEDCRSNLIRLHQLARGRRGLVVLDDVWTSEAFEPLRIQAPGLRTVVTTRNPKLAVSTGGLLVPVGELDPGQSRQLLAQAAEVEVSQLPEEAGALLDELGHLALGIAMAGAMAAGGGPTVWTDLLRRIRDRRLEKITHQFADNYRHARLLAAIEIAVEDLDELADRDRWAELAVFAG